MKIDSNDFRVHPGKEFKLSDRPTAIKPFCKSKNQYRKTLESHVEELSALQHLHYASNRYALLLIFQGIDAAGKDGSIRHVMSGVNPEGCEVYSFKQPSAEELQHDFLRRTTCRLPERGRIGIFNRSYYEEVLVVRVHPEILRNEGLSAELCDEKVVWEQRYRSIQNFETHLHGNGTHIVHALDWDGKIRMNPSSEFAMRPLVALKDKFDLAVACDTDHDRHGIVTRSVGLLPPNHYLAVCVHYLFAQRPHWAKETAVGKTVVSSSMIDRAAARRGRKLYEVPVGFIYFVDGLLHGRLGFAGEESAGSSFARRDGSVWTTDKDGIIAALLVAELAAELGDSIYRRSQAAASEEQKAALEHITASDIHAADLAGEKPITIMTKAPGDHNPIGGIKVAAANGWFAARPSGTEAIYKIYAESFGGEKYLALIEAEAQTIANQAFASAAQKQMTPELQETK